MSTDEMVEITSKAETINPKDSIKWTAQVLERKTKTCHKLKQVLKGPVNARQLYSRTKRSNKKLRELKI